MYKLVFYILVFLLPINLGKHFVFNFSYLNGLLVDYLIPTLYVQDIFVFFLLLFWFVSRRKRIFLNLKDSWLVRIIFILLFSIFLSVIVSINFQISIYTYVRYMIYAFFSVLISISLDLKKEWSTFIFVLAASTFLLEILALGQWFKQGSVFSNYLFFGEQPYSFSTYGISKESFFGQTVIPPYGLFRHPNVLAGYLSVVLLWFISTLEKVKSRKYKTLLILCIFLGILVILFTTSITGLVSFLGGVLIFGMAKVRIKKWRVIYLLVLFVFITGSLSLPSISKNFFQEDPSFYRRADLYKVASEQLDNYVLFGSGFGSSTELSALYFDYFDSIKYPQPVHNIFILVFLESGVFTFIFYVILFAILLNPFKEYNSNYRDQEIVLTASFFQFTLLGLFDHYILTMHQTNLLFWLTVSFYFAYNNSDKIKKKTR